MRSVVLEQVRVGLRVAQVVDGDELQVVPYPTLRALVGRAQDVAADAAETVDGYLDGHDRMLLTAIATFSGVKPKCLKSSGAGADSPKRPMPTTAPSSPTYLRQ